MNESKDKIKYVFSGHESFYCKPLWLKKGYDFVKKDLDFNSVNAVLELGVGKNMVSSIKFWLRSFGLLSENNLTPLADYFFDDENGKDKYIEDLGTLWLLHYHLIITDYSSIYKLFFMEFQKERNSDFNKDNLHLFLKRKIFDTQYAHLYNENTVKRDIGVLFQNYVTPQNNNSNEDFSALLVNLNLIKNTIDKKYYFNYKGKNELNHLILLYAIIDYKKDDQVVSFEKLMDLALIFCLTKLELIDMIISLVDKFPETLRFTDDGGIKQLFFLNNLELNDILELYFSKK